MWALRLTTCITINTRWVKFCDVKIARVSQIYSVLRRLHIGIAISTRWVRFHYVGIYNGFYFFQCVLRKLYACITIGSNVLCGLRKPYVGILFGTNV